tara:strand:- start:335 stop:529 length:195 start_codon:yes stop_codon:yes gene_type:complete
MCNKIKNKAGMKTAFLKVEKTQKFSIKINIKSENQLMISPNLIIVFLEDLTACITASSEIIKNR